MRAAQVTTLTGPAGVELTDVAEPERKADQVAIEVHAVGVSFPDLLLSRGLYQLRPEPPFTLGVDIAGVVVDAPEPWQRGQRVAAVMPYGGAAERVVVGTDGVFALPDALTFEEGAAIPLNYLTAEFALRSRGAVQPGETVLIHGGAGGVGTASIQVARGLGARTIAVVSTEKKADFARVAGADASIVLRSGADSGLREAVGELTEGVGVDVVLDVVGGDLFTDSLRALAPLGRLLVVGFASGQGIPEVKVNRLLLNNIDVRGLGWGAYAMVRPGYMRQQWRTLEPWLVDGTIKPPIGAAYEFEGFAQALTDLDERRVLGKSIVRVP